jgi:hypothetical protein
LGALIAHSASATAETAPLDFAREYIREIVTNERLRELGEKDVNENGANRFMASIRASTRIILELRSQIRVLNGMSLAEPFDKVPTMIARAYEQKIEVNEQWIATSQALLSAESSGPQPGVDYSAMVTETPKLTAKNEYIDRALFQVSPLIFGMLIDSKPDKNGHASRLIITRAQRDQLVESLRSGFGKKMDKKGDQGYFVASGTVLRDLLLKKGYHCADEPMQGRGQ